MSHPMYRLMINDKENTPLQENSFIGRSYPILDAQAHGSSDIFILLPQKGPARD